MHINKATTIPYSQQPLHGRWPSYSAVEPSPPSPASASAVAGVPAVALRASFSTAATECFFSLRLCFRRVDLLLQTEVTRSPCVNVRGPRSTVWNMTADEEKYLCLERVRPSGLVASKSASPEEEHLALSEWVGGSKIDTG